MIETVHFRKGRNYLAADRKTVLQQFESINQAKKHSRQEQKANGGLGLGFVRVLLTR